MAPPKNNPAPQIVTFKQLLKMAHDEGLRSIETDALHVGDDGTAFFKATVTMDNGGKFTGHADASRTNVKPAMLNCLPRMAETRAIVRALRLAVNVGDVAAEELEDYEQQAEYASKPSVTRKPAIETDAPMTPQQASAIQNLCTKRGIVAPLMDGWTQQRAAEQIATLSKSA